MNRLSNARAIPVYATPSSNGKIQFLPRKDIFLETTLSKLQNRSTSVDPILPMDKSPQMLLSSVVNLNWLLSISTTVERMRSQRRLPYSRMSYKNVSMTMLSPRCSELPRNLRTL